MAHSIRRFGSTSVFISNTASATVRAKAIIFTIAKRERPIAPRPNMNIRKAVPVSSNRWTTQWKTSCGWRQAKRCYLNMEAGPGAIFPPCERKDARTLLRKIAEGTHICGDPGMQFDSTIHKWHTCKGTSRQNSTNPCSEYLFLDNTACNLVSLNLMKFKKADGVFDVERFKAAVRIFITAQEIIVDNASYPVKEIAENSHIFRTLGLGYANLGSLVMSYGYGYDSVEARALCGAVTAIMTGEAYEQSALLAKTMGPFPGYREARCSGVTKPAAKDNVASMLEVIDLHRDAVEEIPEAEEFGYLKKEAARAWDRAAELGKRHGYRNAQVTVLAPTGTISFLMDCDTTGIEPDIALVKS